MVLTLIMSLGEWCMNVPIEFLKGTPPLDGTSSSLLSTVIRVLSSIIAGKEIVIPTTPASPENHVDMDFTIFPDSPEFSSTTGTSPTKAKPFMETPFNDTDPSSPNGAVTVAAKMCLGYLINYSGHFPRPQLGAARLNCYINENDDNSFITRCDDKEELSSDIFNAPNILFFVVNNSSIMSFTEITKGDSQLTRERKVRVIVRDLIGKFAWDCGQIVTGKGNPDAASIRASNPGQRNSKTCRNDYEDDTPPPSNRDDMIDTLMQLIGQTSPECVTNKKRQTPTDQTSANSARAEENMIALLLNQHYQEMNYMEQYSETKENVIFRNKSEHDFRLAVRGPNGQDLFSSAFLSCRQLVDQLGFLFWEKRAKVELLCKSDKVLRELRNLDNQKCRETHKIAVIYVAEGQEDKNSILLNTSGSRAFEGFVSGLGWEVDLEKHLGFRGGLQQNRSTGVSAPYFSTPFMEVIYHVSTRMPASLSESDSLIRKLRHLGNDNIHIVWSEHWRDYRRDIIPTEFGDVLIVIYPVPTLPGYYRIHISRKPEVPFFGPLYSGSVVHMSVLAGLVRATAINASRAIRLNVPFYQHFFEERARYIDTIVRSQEAKSFEDFSAAVYSPAQLGLLSSRPVSSLSNMTAAETHSISSMQSLGGEPIPSPRTRNRPVSTGAPSMLSAEPRSSPRSSGPRDRPLSAQPSSPSPAAHSVHHS